MDEQNPMKPLVGIRKLHLILNGLQIASNRLEQEQNTSMEVPGLVSFCFFPVTLGKMIAQMGVLPNHCIENMPVKSRGASKDACQLSIESWRQVLEMLNILRMLPESHKLEQADLNSIEVLCGLPWLHQSDKVAVPESKLEWYQHLAEVLQRKLQCKLIFLKILFGWIKASRFLHLFVRSLKQDFLRVMRQRLNPLDPINFFLKDRAYFTTYA